jgi:hypothetical protein
LPGYPSPGSAAPLATLSGRSSAGLPADTQPRRPSWHGLSAGRPTRRHRSPPAPSQRFALPDSRNSPSSACSAICGALRRHLGHGGYRVIERCLCVLLMAADPVGFGDHEQAVEVREGHGATSPAASSASAWSTMAVVMRAVAGNAKRRSVTATLRLKSAYEAGCNPCNLCNHIRVKEFACVIVCSCAVTTVTPVTTGV